MVNKRDLSISMAGTNVIVSLLTVPVVIAQFAIFILLHGIKSLAPTWDPALLVVAVLLGVPVHELLHAASFVIFGHKSFSAVKFGFQWKALTPYAHLKMPVEVNAYRIATFVPGLVLGILPFISSLLSGDGSLFWFSLVHLSAAGGDWLILWLIRNVKSGMLVEDHPTNAGCYVIES